jgi:filamentous hemagglutinin
LNAVGSDLLKNDTKLNSLNGDLTIQTNSNLTIDPKVYSLKAVGDIELVSKTGTLTLKGYGGTTGNGSEQVVKLDTAKGGINLEGAKVDIQGSQLNAQKDIKIVSSKDDVLIDGIKNTLKNSSADATNIISIENNIKEIDKSINILSNSKEFQERKTLLENIKKTKNSLEAAMPYLFYGANGEYSAGDLSDVNVSNIFFYENAYIKIGSAAEGDSREPIYLVIPVESPVGNSDIYCSLRSEDYQITPLLDSYKAEIKKYKVLNESEKVKDLEKLISKLESEKKSEIKSKELLTKEVNGSEHTEAKLTSKSGNINITSAKGLSISGGNISAQLGQVNLEASGVLAEQYKSSISSGANQPPKSLNASIIIDGHTDFYEKGTESEGNYSFRTLVSPTIINGDKGVNIRTVGKTKDDNLVLQATGITSKNGGVKIESNKSILFDAAIEQSYDLTTSTEKKKSWGGLKKKYITTVSENNDTNAASVDISAKNISIETKKLDPSVDAKTPDNNIDIYSGRFTAEGGTISIKSGGNLNFYTVEESSSSTVDVTKKTSYSKLISLLASSKTTTNTTRTQVSELPATLKADYIGTKSGFDTKLVGTEFEYLKDATIETGGTLELIAAKTSITDLVKKEKSSLAWQAMQDKGSITETAQLPSFNGPVLPTFKAAGGLSVQVPISEKDANKVELRNAILELSKQPGNEYLKEFVNRKDVDWQIVLLTQKDWDYKSQGLTGAGAAIIAIVVTMVTAGAGAAVVGALGGSAATLGGSAIAMTQAALTSLATQASVSLINNGGNIGKTLKELGSKDSIKNLAASVVTAGLLSQVSTALNLKPDSTVFSDRLVNNFTTSVGSTLVQTAINGGDLEENLKVALLSGLAGALQGQMAQNIKGLEDINYIAHKLAHALAGCIAGAIQGQCQAGAIGGAVGEIVAGFTPPSSGLLYTEEEKQKILMVGQLTSGIIAAYAGYDVNVASNSANIALTNNAFNEKKVKELLEQAKGYMGEKGGQALDAVSRGIAKGDINALKNAQTQIAEYLLKKADSGGLSQAEMVTFGTLYALNETLFPTNILDVIPGAGKAIGKGNDLLKGIRAAAPASAASATARLGLREDLAKLANIPRNMEIQPANIWGKTIQDIKYSFEMDGAVLTLAPPKSSTSGFGQVYSVKNSATGIKEFEYHPGGGTHSSDGVRYYKIVMNDGTQFRIIDPKSDFKPGTITSNQIYLNPNGQKLKYQNGKWEIWK